MGNNKIDKGDKVAWNWGGGAPGGTATEVKEDGEVKMETKSGNEVKKKGEPENPAVYIERGGHDVVKKASELHIEKKASRTKESAATSSKDSAKSNSANKNASKVQKSKSKKSKNGGSQPRRSRRLATKPEQ